MINLENEVWFEQLFESLSEELGRIPTEQEYKQEIERRS